MSNIIDNMKEASFSKTHLLVAIRLILFAFIISILPAGAQPNDQGGARNPDAWKQHEAAALDALEHASECLRNRLESAGKCDSGIFFRKALTEYDYLESLFKEGSGDSIEASHIAEGYVRSGSPTRAIEFLLNRPQIMKESGLLRLLAETLFSIGDDKAAALAYKSWITTGCGGYNSAGKQSGLVFWVKKGKECSQLPIFLRSRLELLQKTADGEPVNLPKQNDPPFEDDFRPHH